MLPTDQIKKNLAKARENIKKACVLSGRDPSEVVLTLAGKTIPQEVLLEVCKPENITVGENRVQEFVAKYTPELDWHIIGQLQSNKVKYVLGKVSLIHSLDRLSLAEEIDKRAERLGVFQDCLIEVNMGSEISKGGIPSESLCEFFDSLKPYQNIRIKGIMAVMPIAETGVLEAYYDRLNALYVDLKQKSADIQYLSAGMSNDYEIAVRHGANLLRLGSAVFGARAPLANG